MKNLLFALLILTLLTSCSKDKDETVDYTAQNEQEIKAYLADSLTAQRTASGLYYVIKKQGEGDNPKASSNVTVKYKGYYTSGKVFDKSDNAGISFGLSQVIQGWKEGIPFFKPQGEGILLVPAHLGYGSSDYKSIPGGSVLIFDIKLLSVN